MIRFLLIPVTLCFLILPSYSAIKGGVDYTIPIDYSKYNRAELETKAEYYYGAAVQSKKLDNNMTMALNLYTMLSNAYPDSISYALRLGKLYDVLGKDKYAKGQYYRGVGLNKSAPEPYYYLGNFYYNREQYRKALKFYKRAYEKGYINEREIKDKINSIYIKFGDKTRL